jgi:hypothetical protein
MIYKSILRTIPATALLLGAGLFSSPQTVFAHDSQEQVSYFEEENIVTVELKELSSLMGQLNYDADQLRSVQHSARRWETHASQLSQVKERVNLVGAQFKTLQSLRSIAAPWQQETIDRTLPIAAQVAASTSAALNHLNENRTRLYDPEYVGHLHRIGALSKDMHDIVDTHLKIIEARDRIQTLEDKLADSA